MILLDPDLDRSPHGNRLKELPIRRDAGSVRRSGAGTPTNKWRRAPLPWAERLPTPVTLNRFLREAQDAVKLRGLVSVLLTTDKAIRRLNRDFRGKNKATDVLSFPAVDLYAAARLGPGAPALRIDGDLAISVDTARKQAAQQGHALTCELKILVLHGLLHLAGYDHETDKGEMARRETQLRAQFGLPLGLIERASNESASQRVSKSARRSIPTLAAKGVGRMGHPTAKVEHPARANKKPEQVCE